jgi:hypothetical protein
LHELSRLHDETPEAAQALVASGAEITRTRVAALREAACPVLAKTAAPKSSVSLLSQANAVCTRMELALDRVQHAGLGDTDLEALRNRVTNLVKRLTSQV